MAVGAAAAGQGGELVAEASGAVHVAHVAGVDPDEEGVGAARVLAVGDDVGLAVDLQGEVESVLVPGQVHPGEARVAIHGAQVGQQGGVVPFAQAAVDAQFGGFAGDGDAVAEEGAGGQFDGHWGS